MAALFFAAIVALLPGEFWRKNGEKAAFCICQIDDMYVFLSNVKTVSNDPGIVKTCCNAH